MDNVLKFRSKPFKPENPIGELYETSALEIDDILDMVRGNLKKMVLVAIDDSGEAIVASYPNVLNKDEVTEVFELVQELVFGHEQHS